MIGRVRGAEGAAAAMRGPRGDQGRCAVTLNRSIAVQRAAELRRGFIVLEHVHMHIFVRATDAAKTKGGRRTIGHGVGGENGGVGPRGSAEGLWLGVGFGCGGGGDRRGDERMVSSGACRTVVGVNLSTGAGWNGHEGILGVMGRILLSP